MEDIWRVLALLGLAGAIFLVVGISFEIIRDVRDARKKRVVRPVRPVSHQKRPDVSAVFKRQINR